MLGSKKSYGFYVLLFVCIGDFDHFILVVLLVFFKSELNPRLKRKKWGAFHLFIADFFATQIIGGVKELVVLL